VSIIWIFKYFKAMQGKDMKGHARPVITNIYLAHIAKS
jgi:hypothetical protein